MIEYKLEYMDDGMAIRCWVGTAKHTLYTYVAEEIAETKEDVCLLLDQNLSFNLPRLV